MNSIEHLIPEKERNLIKDLEKLLDFINSELSTHGFRYKEVRLKKLFLYQALGDLFTKTSAIYSLLREGKTIACAVLLRTVVESFINIEYVFSDRKEENLLKLYIEDSEERIKLGNKAKDFFHGHPDFKPFGGEEDSEIFWENYCAKAKNEILLIKKLKRKPGISTLRNLRDKAVYVDRIRKTNIEWWYINLYWLFSQDTHTTMRGLDNHFTNNKEEVFFELEGDVKDIERIAVTTFIFLYSVTDKFFDKFNLDRNKLEPYKKIFKSYLSRASL